MRIRTLTLVLCCGLGLFLSGISLSAQSTQGSLVGTVKDSSGAVIAGAKVTVTNVDSHTIRATKTDASGDYHLLNLEPAHYSLNILREGFKSGDVQHLELLSRQELRTDVTLQVGSSTQQVVVDADAAAVMTTETASISSTLGARAIQDLPANYRSISTSPLNVIQTLPGVQADSGTFPPRPAANAAGAVNFSIQGGLPSQAETTIDGISAQNVSSNAPLSDAFPSANSIAEIRVDGSMNDAQFGQPGEITTITKSGTDSLHGSAFWYFQNSGFDAVPFGATSKPKKVANDFGVNIGGPIVIPHIYNGKGKTFFFGDYEGFRFPQGQPVQYLVPTAAMRAGDFSQELAAGKLINPFTNTPYAGNRLSSLNPASVAFLSLFPLPNFGNTTSVAAAAASPGYNYATNKPANYESNQFDVRVDHYFGQKALLFSRYTSKDIDLQNPSLLNIPNSTVFDRYRILVASFSYNISPTMINELRFGFTLEQNGSSNPLNGAELANKSGLNGIGPSFPFNGVTELDFSTVTSENADRLGSGNNSRLFQYADDLTWVKNTHTFKFGADIRHVRAITPLGFIGANNYGTFSFTGIYSGNDFADYLLGVPQKSSLVNVSQDNDGASNAYSFYAQDAWKATPRLVINYGIRYEFHPAYHAGSGNIGNFDGSVPGTGRLLYPDGKESLLSPSVLANVNACPVAGVNNPYATGAPANGVPCTPVLSNSAAGVPPGLREAPVLRFMPRLGMAFRPFNNNKTVIRGGGGFYNITTLGSSFFSLTGTLQSDVRTFTNQLTPTGPQIVFPNTSNGGTGLSAPSLGTAAFGTANDVHWKDPYSIQWNLSVDRDLGKEWGARISYIAMRTEHLVRAPDLNNMSYSTTIASKRPLSDRPFPNWLTINDRASTASAIYHSMQVEISHHFRSGLSMNAAYTLAKNLSNNQVPNKPGFPGENGGGKSTYLASPDIDFGDVYGTRRNRVIETATYQLPIGRGKAFGSDMNRWADLLVGGWQLSNIFLFQTGTYLTPFIPSGQADPSGTGSGTLSGRAQYPDRVPGVSLTPPGGRNRNSWINPAAFACPSNTGYTAATIAGHKCTVGVGSTPIGRFGNSRVGVVEGPGTVNLSAGLRKTFPIEGRFSLRAEGTFTNILNHTNLADPSVNVTTATFGVSTQSRGSDFGGNRTGQVSLMLQF